MDQYFKFNITGTTSFEGIKFSGIEGASNYKTDHYPPVNRIPRKKCEVEKGFEPLSKRDLLPIKKAIQFSIIEDEDEEKEEGRRTTVIKDDLECILSRTLNFEYKSDFTDTSNERCVPADYLNEQQSVRNSTGEPYKEEFWIYDDDIEIEEENKIYYLRHTVLFNLYNFPGGVGRNYASFAELDLIECEFEFFHMDYKALINVENNNMQIQNMTAELYPENKPNLMIFGDDRGANIKITDSTF